MSDSLRAVQDELEIGRLLARVAQLADDGDPADYIGCFTADAIWDLENATDLPLDSQRIQGHEALLRGVHERRASGVQGPGSHTRHDVSTIVIQVSGDEATARTYFRYYRDADSIPTLIAIGCYQDRFVRTTLGWRLHHRRIGRN